MASGASRSSRWITGLVVLLNVVFNYVYITMFPGPSIAEVSAKYPTLLTPAGFTFSIWGLIYLSQLAYVIYQLLPTQRSKTAPDVINPFLILSSLLGMFWIICFRAEWMPLSVLVIFAMLFTAIYTLHTAHRVLPSEEHPAWLIAPFSLFAGWLSVATIVNVAAFLVSQGFEGGFLLPSHWAALLLSVAFFQAILVLWRWKDYIYPLVICWAALGIWMALRDLHPSLSLTALVLAGLLLLLTVFLYLRSRKASFNP